MFDSTLSQPLALIRAKICATFSVWFACFLIAGSLVAAPLEQSRPASLIAYEVPNATVLVVDKSQCQLSVYRYEKEWSKLKSFECTTGKKIGNKQEEGDLKTPNGVYWIEDAWSGKELLRRHGPTANVYGSGAFALTYPNYFDKVIEHKGGSGIWIHGTLKTDPIATRGCVSLNNLNLLKLVPYVELEKTAVIIEEKTKMLSAKELKQTQTKLKRFLKTWKNAWENNDNARYLSSYSKKFRTERFNYKGWERHKRRVNSLNSKRQIKIEDLSIFKTADVYYIQFTQHYQSSRTKDVGTKQLFVKEEKGGMRILSENWTQQKPQAPLPTAFRYAYKQAMTSL